MSRPNIKFVYTGQFHSEVQHMQKGPAKLENLYGSIIHPEYLPISIEDTNPNQTQIVSTVQVNSKPTSPTSIVRYKSAENIRMREEEPRGNNAANGVLNIEEVSESEMKARKQRQFKKQNNQQSDQLVLKAPSYKFVPRKEGEISVHSRKQLKKHVSVQKALAGETVLRSRRQTNRLQNQNQLKTSNPLLKIQAVNERDFKAEPSEQQSSNNNSAPQSNVDERIVLKAPKYKYVPKPDNQVVVNNKKKEYVKAQNTAQKYFYGGIQTRQESEFVSCFGCMKPTAKTYKAQDD